MTFAEQTSSAVARLAARLSETERRLAALERKGVRVPVVDDDPDPADPTNIWMFNDGTLKWRDADGDVHAVTPDQLHRPPLPTFGSTPAVSTGWRLWVRGSDSALQYYNSSNVVKTVNPTATSGAPDGGTVPPPPPTSPVPKPVQSRRYTHQSTFYADQATCYCPVHGTESELYFGRWSGTHGERRCMFGFDATAIRAALTPTAEIIKVELIATSLHAYANGGVTIRWGAHNVDGLGAGFSQNYAGTFSAKWPKSGGRTWRTISNWHGYAFRDAKIRGLTIDQPSSSVGYYGQVRSDVGLRFTYANNTP